MNAVHPTVDSNMEIHIAQLRSALARGVVLGDYVVRGVAGDGGGTFRLHTLQGVLQLDGAGKCTPGRQFSCGFEGTARTARHEDALIGNLLGLLGKQQGQKNPESRVTDKDFVTELRW
jgi:hypothetical protein